MKRKTKVKITKSYHKAKKYVKRFVTKSTPYVNATKTVINKVSPVLQRTSPSFAYGLTQPVHRQEFLLQRLARDSWVLERYKDGVVSAYRIIIFNRGAFWVGRSFKVPLRSINEAIQLAKYNILNYIK